MANGDSSADLTSHCADVADALLKGRVVPFLGAGVNLCDRPPGETWTAADKKFLPTGSELAEHLAREFHYPGRPEKLATCPDPGVHLDLARVSQYAATRREEGPLNEELREVFEPTFQPTAVHRFLAGLRAPVANPPTDKHLLIVTTNYDDLMEQALGKDSFDVVYYRLIVKDNDRRGRFWHKAPHAEPKEIPDPATYPYEFFKDRPVVLKVHGSIDRAQKDRGTFVITEDHYIEYISEEPMERLLPPRLLQKMREKHHLLFLGYSLRDWNFRVFLRRLKRSGNERYQAWAVFLKPDQTERKFWEKNGVDIVDCRLREYVGALQKELDSRLSGVSPGESACG